MKGLIESIRIPECLLVSILCFLGFKYSGIHPDFLTIITRFFVMAATMVQNDWVDRFHDLKKGKRFATDRSRMYFKWLIFIWAVCFAFVIFLFLKNSSAGLFLFTLAILGAFYSEARRVPFLSVFLVSVPMIGATVLIPITFGANFTSLLPLFIATTLIMFGRETLHDIADVSADRGYKKTIPLVIGEKISRLVSGLALFVGCIFTIFISPISILGSIFIFWGLINVMSEELVVKVRKRVDIGLTLLALGLIL